MSSSFKSAMMTVANKKKKENALRVRSALKKSRSNQNKKLSPATLTQIKKIAAKPKALKTAAASQKRKTKAEATVPARITIVDLKIGMCKWPLGTPGDADFHFCGKSTAQLASYCTSHAQEAYHVVPSKKKKKMFRRESMMPSLVMHKKPTVILEEMDA